MSILFGFRNPLVVKFLLSLLIYVQIKKNCRVQHKNSVFFAKFGLKIAFFSFVVKVFLFILSILHGISGFSVLKKNLIKKILELVQSLTRSRGHRRNANVLTETGNRVSGKHGGHLKVKDFLNLFRKINPPHAECPKRGCRVVHRRPGSEKYDRHRG